MIELNFSQWLEEKKSWGLLSWDGRRWYDSSGLLGDRPAIKVFWDGKKVEPENTGPKHPMLKRALKILLKQRPEFRDRKIEFDGYSPGTVGEFLKKHTLPPWEMPPYFYQGTSQERWERIEEEGLRPRSETKMPAAYGAHISSAPRSNPNYVYLAGSPGAATRLAAHDATRGTGDDPVVLQIDSKGMKYELLRPDEDSRANDWQDSMSKLDSIGYEGTIKPQFIKLHRVYDRSQHVWTDPPPPKPYKPDWLAKQFMDRSDMKPVPGTEKASYKWANPKK